tara:strand:- start:1801 stop:1938 length:138 start_codon:yes stop_codon:yes gene_type:complete
MEEIQLDPEIYTGETYTIHRLTSWDDEIWDRVVEAVEDTTASFGD